MKNSPRNVDPERINVAISTIFFFSVMFSSIDEFLSLITDVMFVDASDIDVDVAVDVVEVVDVVNVADAVDAVTSDPLSITEDAVVVIAFRSGYFSWIIIVSSMNSNC